MKQHRVAVIGAGIAGLAAARTLHRAGIEVVVFEKARGVGGRTSTRRREPDAFDHGAQYFTCKTRAFAAQVEDWQRRGVVAAWEAPVHSLGTENPEHESHPPERFVGTPGMSALARDLASDLTVRTGQRVERISRRSAPDPDWLIQCEDAPPPEEVFGTVIVAAPAPQAASLLTPVPLLARQAASVKMVACQAALVTFDEPLALPFGGAFVEDETLAWVARNTSKPKRPERESWVLHATPEWTHHHQTDSPQRILTLMLAAFGRATGRPLPKTVFEATHCWKLARAPKPLAVISVWDPSASIGVCGDWLCGSRVEDAFQSGEHLGAALRTALRGPRS